MLTNQMKVILLRAIILLHYFVFIALVSALPLSIIYQPWYMAVAVWTLVIRTAMSPEICPLSALEVKLQNMLGLEEKKKFMKQHVLIDALRLKNYVTTLFNNIRGVK